jgi:hypothetical protein
MSTAEPPEMVVGSQPLVLAKVIPAPADGAGLLGIPIRSLAVWRLVVWRLRRSEEWRNGGMAEWRNGGMVG